MTTQETYALNRRIAEALRYRFEEQIDPLSETPATIIWRQDGTSFVEYAGIDIAAAVFVMEWLKQQQGVPVEESSA